MFHTHCIKPREGGPASSEAIQTNATETPGRVGLCWFLRGSALQGWTAWLGFLHPYSLITLRAVPLSQGRCTCAAGTRDMAATPEQPGLAGNQPLSLRSGNVDIWEEEEEEEEEVGVSDISHTCGSNHCSGEDSWGRKTGLQITERGFSCGCIDLHMGVLSAWEQALSLDQTWANRPPFPTVPSFVLRSNLWLEKRLCQPIYK